MDTQGQLNFDNGPPKEYPFLGKSPRQQGQEEAIKESAKEQIKEEEKLDSLVEKSRGVLLRINGFFPFDFFPNEITIDVNQVCIIIKEFFFDTGRRHNIFIKNIVDVYVDTNPFFGTLRITERGFVEVPIEVKYLKKEDAKRARRIIQGLQIAHLQGIDMTKIETDQELLHKLEELGRGK